MKKFENWLNEFGKAWISRDPQKAASLFSQDVEYYESALKPPHENWGKVFELWKVVPTNQKDITFDFDIINTSENLCIVNWKVERTLLHQNTRQKIDGIFVIKLNKDGLCNYFKQWRTVEQD